MGGKKLSVSIFFFVIGERTTNSMFVQKRKGVRKMLFGRAVVCCFIRNFLTFSGPWLIRFYEYNRNIIDLICLLHHRFQQSKDCLSAEFKLNYKRTHPLLVTGTILDEQRRAPGLCIYKLENVFLLESILFIWNSE